MKFSALSFVVLCLMFVQSAWCGLNYEVTWNIKGNVGFSGPTEIRDATTGRTVGIVVCEVGNGIVCFSPQGKRLWEYAMTPPVTAYPAVADVDGDGIEDVVACDGAGKLVLLSETGQLKWTAHTPGAVRAESCPTIADLNGDGWPEILVGDTEGYVSCFNNKGKMNWCFRGDGTQMGPTLVADIYKIPGKEIVVTSHDHHIYALTAQGVWLWDIYRENDLFPYSTPLLADVDGDEIPELYIGGGLHHFYRIDLKQHRIAYEENVFMHVNSAICATDIDLDGKDEVIFGNKGGTAYCYDENGFAWKREFSNVSMSHSPIVVNLDDDPELEVIFLNLTLDTDGSVLLHTKMPGRTNSSPLAGDFDNDGRLEIIVAGYGMFGSNALTCLKWNVPYRNTPNDWTVFAGNRAHTCRIPTAKNYPVLALPLREKKTSDANFKPYGDMNILSGLNTWRFDVTNPKKDRLVLLTDVAYPDGSVRHFANHLHSEKQRVSLSFNVQVPGTYQIKQELLEADRPAIISSREMPVSFEGLAGDKKYLNDVLFTQTAEAIRAWQGSNPVIANYMRNELLGVKGRLAVLEKSGNRLETEFLSDLIKSARRLQSLAVAGQALAPTGSFFPWKFCPWAYFNAQETLPTPQNRTEQLNTELCIGEYESIALNLTNISPQTLDVRILAGDLIGEKTFPADKHLEFRRAITVSTLRRKRIADALPLLGQGRLLTIPSMETQQLWITVNAIDTEPGDYVAKLHLKSLEPDPTEVVIPLHIKVHNLRLPHPSPLRFCVWAMANSAPDYELKDLVDHGVNIHFGTCPRATCDKNGEITGKLDFSKHDASVRRLAPHGLVMFIGPQGSLGGQPFLSEPWRKAFIAYLREWVSHMKETGMTYEDWALYPYDEPSTPYAPTTLNLVKVAKLIREADPNILIYTDPTCGTTMESVEMLTGLIDIWCPSDELLERFGDELLPAIRPQAKEIWFYAASGRSRTLSCLGLYRWRFWYAWNLGFTGAGWWTYHYGDYLWDGPNPSGDYFSTVYRSPGAIVTSKRWEVAREGIEDYEILYLLKDAVKRAKNRSITDNALNEAEKLLEELPRTIQATLHDTGRRLPLTPDSVPMYTRATEVVQDARKRIVETCIRLNEVIE